MKPQRNPPPVRVYVTVNSTFDATGAVTPRSIIWADGRRFKIDSIRDFRPASVMEERHAGDCYTVMIHGEEKRLYFERTRDTCGSRLGRWWVECSPAAAP